LKIIPALAGQKLRDIQKVKGQTGVCFFANLFNKMAWWTSHRISKPAGLPRQQRVSLARLLIELDDPGRETDAENAWNTEIQARVRAVNEGLVEVIPYEQVLARVDTRLAS